MTGERKTEPPLKLDMDFGEALERFVRVKPKEVAESVERAKTKMPLGDPTSQRPVRGDGGSALGGRKRKPASD